MSYKNLQNIIFNNAINTLFVLLYLHIWLLSDIAHDSLPEESVAAE